MKIIKPSYEIMAMPDPSEIMRLIEKAGRTCYKSEHKITPDSAVNFVKGIMKSGHESIIEHVNITVKFICDRGVMAELTRHRLCAFSIESTRYCNYASDKFDNEITVILPTWVDLPVGSYCLSEADGISLNRRYEGENVIYPGDNFKCGIDAVWWLTSMLESERYYISLLGLGWTPEKARSVLPNSLKTEIVMTANLREWRHILKLRTSDKAHPQIREIMLPLLAELKKELPAIFSDIA